MSLDCLMPIKHAMIICKYPYSLSSEMLVEAVCCLNSNIEQLTDAVHPTEDETSFLNQLKNYVCVLESILVARDRKARDHLAVREPYPSR